MVVRMNASAARSENLENKYFIVPSTMEKAGTTRTER
jgi:hypothetical protein